jgi:hypothetical protein
VEAAIIAPGLAAPVRVAYNAALLRPLIARPLRWDKADHDKTASAGPRDAIHGTMAVALPSNGYPGGILSIQRNPVNPVYSL